MKLQMCRKQLSLVFQSKLVWTSKNTTIHYRGVFVILASFLKFSGSFASKWSKFCYCLHFPEWERLGYEAPQLRLHSEPLQAAWKTRFTQTQCVWCSSLLPSPRWPSNLSANAHLGYSTRQPERVQIRMCPLYSQKHHRKRKMSCFLCCCLVLDRIQPLAAAR